MRPCERLSSRAASKAARGRVRRLRVGEGGPDCEILSPVEGPEGLRRRGDGSGSPFCLSSSMGRATLSGAAPQGKTS